MENVTNPLFNPVFKSNRTANHVLWSNAVKLFSNGPDEISRSTGSYVVCKTVCFQVTQELEHRRVNSSEIGPVSYTHLRAHETPEHLVCRLLLEKKKKKEYTSI